MAIRRQEGTSDQDRSSQNPSELHCLAHAFFIFIYKTHDTVWMPSVFIHLWDVGMAADSQVVELFCWGVLGRRVILSSTTNEQVQL